MVTGTSTFEMRVVSTPEQDQHDWMVQQERMDQLRDQLHDRVWRMTVQQFEGYVQVMSSDLFYQIFDQVLDEMSQEEYEKQANERRYE